MEFKNIYNCEDIITVGSTSYTGVIKTQKGVVCKKCEGKSKMQMTFHIDGKDEASSTYQCGCGNVIGAVTKRTMY